MIVLCVVDVCLFVCLFDDVILNCFLYIFYWMYVIMCIVDAFVCICERLFEFACNRLHLYDFDCICLYLLTLTRTALINKPSFGSFIIPGISLIYLNLLTCAWICLHLFVFAYICLELLEFPCI